MPGGGRTGETVAHDVQTEVRAISGGENELKARPLCLLERPAAVSGHLGEMAELFREDEVGDNRQR